MNIRDFDYHLPEELIAQYPRKQRDHSRMMVLNRATGDISDSVFYRLPEMLTENDVLVINDSKVIPARLIGQKETGGRIDILLLTRMSGSTGPTETWEVLLRPARRVKEGMRIFISSECEAIVNERVSEKKWKMTFITHHTFESFLKGYGHAPLPPYIKRKGTEDRRLNDLERYQTVYARVPGSIAAPTAGLHFSREVLEILQHKGVHIVSITLHVGYGTFLPIEEEIVENHVMEEEYYEISPEAAEKISEARRVIAVGTTSTRAIESATDETGRIKNLHEKTRLFIYPGYHFKRVNALITNFHLPRSSLYLLVCAFAGKSLVEKAYQRAIEKRYRFYSYGDCMFIT